MSKYLNVHDKEYDSHEIFSQSKDSNLEVIKIFIWIIKNSPSQLPFTSLESKVINTENTNELMRMIDGLLKK